MDSLVVENLGKCYILRRGAEKKQTSTFRDRLRIGGADGDKPGAQELTRLIDSATVGLSWLFRDPDQLATGLAQQIRQRHGVVDVASDVGVEQDRDLRRVGHPMIKTV